MNQHPSNFLFHAINSAVLPQISKEAHAVADAIGCPCMTDNQCDSKGGCYCQQAADRVIELQKVPA